MNEPMTCARYLAIEKRLADLRFHYDAVKDFEKNAEPPIFAVAEELFAELKRMKDAK
jgi:hypothetical protein